MGSAVLIEMVDGTKKAEDREDDEEERGGGGIAEEGEEALLLPAAVKMNGNGGGTPLAKPKRRVTWNDLNGSSLAEVKEFHPSDSESEDDESNGGSSPWDAAVLFVANLCTLLTHCWPR